MGLQCFLKVKKSLSQEKILRGFCLDRVGPFFLFDEKDVFLNNHSQGIQDRVTKHRFKYGAAIPYELSAEEEKAYLCPKTKKFMFKKKLLIERQTFNNNNSCM